MKLFSRIFVLALDGLEYNLVVKYHLESLLQVVCGYVDVSNFTNLLTPVIWTSFITGREPHEHGIYSWWRFSRHGWLDRLAHWVRWHVPLIRSMSSAKLKRVLKVLGFKLRPPSKEDLRVSTMFDLVRPSKALFVPGYNEEPWIRDYYSEAFEGGLGEAENAVWKVHEYRKARLFEELEKNRDWKLFMVWFDLADWIGHFYMGKSELKVMRAYFELAKLASQIREKISEDTLMIIVSDHGMEPGGEHSPRAFYSFNMNVNWRPRKITDFFYFITSRLQ